MAVIAPSANDGQFRPGREVAEVDLWYSLRMDLAHAPTLYLICGKIASGKSSLARRLAARPATLLISEDHWTSTLFSGELKTIEDYGRCSALLRAAMGPH